MSQSSHQSSVQLNLLPDVKKEYLQSQRTKNTLISICVLTTIGATGLAAIFFALVYLVQPGLIGGAQAAVDSKTKQLKGVKDIEKYLTVQNQLNSLPELHEGKVLYSRIFSYLKTLNPAAPNNVRLASLVVDEENKEISINGATDNFQAFSVFQDTLKNAKLSYKVDGETKEGDLLFEEGSIIVDQQDLTRSEGKQELSFTMRIRYNEPGFSPANTDPVLSVPKKETTQSAVNAPSLFEEAPRVESGE
ncbi:hypothetical protein JNJ66_06305 [Candidatus Saccharibacteria bacterium]|nr:hypothetical protein [Candidatus Saccharibacteria bacterium]